MRKNLVVLIGLLSGCSTQYRVEHVTKPTVDPHQPHAQFATICVLRPQTFGAIAAFEHRDNGQLMGLTEGARVYFCYLAEPGIHHLVAHSDNDAKATLVVGSAEVHFVRLEVGFGPDSLFPLNNRDAAVMLPQLRPVRTVPRTADAPAPYPLPAPAVPGSCPCHAAR